MALGADNGGAARRLGKVSLSLRRGEMSANPLRDYPDRKMFAEVDHISEVNHISNATFTRPEDLDASNSCDLGQLPAGSKLYLSSVTLSPEFRIENT